MSFFAKTLEFINDSGEVTGDPILRDKLQTFLYYDFTRLTGANAAAISNGNAGLVDLSGNGHTGTIVGTPVVRDITVNNETIKTLEDNSTHAINTGITGATFMGSTFIMYMVIQSTDGQPSATQNIIGGIKPTNVGFNVFIDTAGKIGVAVGTASGFFVFTTTAAVFSNSVNETSVISVRVAWGSTVTITKNGVNQAGTFTSGAISTPTAANIASEFTINMYVGSLNNNGTAATNPNQTSILKVAFTNDTGLVADFAHIALEEALVSYSWVNWEAKESHVTSGNASTMRSDFITDIIDSGSLPTISPTTTTGISGAIHICNTSNITNDSSWDRLTFDMLDVDGFTWSHKCYLGHTNQTPNGNLIIVNNGHQSDVAAGYESLMSTLLGLGYDVLYTAMPVVGDNTETNPTITTTSSTGHNQMLSGGLDRVGYSPIELFLFDKISAINHLNGSYTKIGIVGNSGGGWTSCLVAAIDTRVDWTFINRGVGLRSFKIRESAIDYEQGGMPSHCWNAAILGTTVSGTRLHTIFTDTSYFDLMALCATGGRHVYRTSHFTDTCCFVGSQSWVWQDKLKTKSAELGGFFHNIIDFNPNRATHGFSTFDIGNIVHALGNL